LRSKYVLSQSRLQRLQPLAGAKRTRSATNISKLPDS
jgi:hypothetical protein